MAKIRLLKIAFLEHFRSRLREFRTANAANVTLTFAFATVPMIGVVGAAVDYSRANAVKASMQAAADSTALMLSRDAVSLNNNQLQTKANDYFKALYTRTDGGTGLVVSATYTSNAGSQVVVNAETNVPTNFMGIMGFSSLKVAVDSQVKWGNTKLRVALVLDTTGSMAAAGKIDALKTATKALLDQLRSAAARDGDVYISIIPFSKDVNVGGSNHQATWIDWTEWENINGDCSKDTRRREFNKSQCADRGGTWTPDNKNTWNGCVMDRGDSSAPSSFNTDQNVMGVDLTKRYTKFAAEQYDYCSPRIMPLSYDWTSMRNLVNSFYPSGNTNQGIGLAHGWMSLVGGGPYPAPPAEDPNYRYQKIIILMSDGLNTQNRWYNNQTSIDDRQATTCANVKAAGITLYTIHVNTDGDPMSTLLKNCASSADKFWMLTSANAMVATFQAIGTALSNLRISQ